MSGETNDSLNLQQANAKYYEFMSQPKSEIFSLLRYSLDERDFA